MNPMLNNTARLLPLQEKSDTPTNAQGKPLCLCCTVQSADYEAGKLVMSQMEGSETNVLSKGKPVSVEPCDD